ncbi:MAG: fumarylacetoacetate hydrolase family protein [Actinobacteria bacterium]|nr:fumarylacetoacetate hydrolase family protein [Actinomycetota bacterium]
MKIVRYEHGSDSGFGILHDDVINEIEGSSERGLYESERSFPIYESKLLAPVVPTKVVAVGLNYKDHAEELNMEIPDHPIIFIKVPNTVIGSGEKVYYPPQSEQVDYEAELGIVIGRTAYRVSETEAEEAVLGYTCALDMTARDLQHADVQWSRAKNFDTFCPLGPWIETAVDPEDLAIELRLNGEVKQSSRTSQMIFKPLQLVSFVSNVMTLHPGDVIITGTPPGVGEVKPGDKLEVKIESIGTLNTTIASL